MNGAVRKGIRPFPAGSLKDQDILILSNATADTWLNGKSAGN